MRTARIWILTLLAGVIASGCTVGSTLVPVTNTTERLQFRGFSILPPKGANWFMATSPIVPDPYWKWTVLFTKQPVGSHTIYAAVQGSSIEDVVFKSRNELLQVAAKALLEESKRDPQFKPTDARVSFDKFLGYDCVRFELIFEAYSPQDFPGATFILTRRGFILPHPESPNFIVWLEYSQRYPKRQHPLLLEPEVEPFLNSLMFTSLR